MGEERYTLLIHNGERYTLLINNGQEDYTLRLTTGRRTTP